MELQPVSHTGSLLVRKHDLLGTEFSGKEDTGNLGSMDAGPIQLTVRKIHSPEVGLAEIASAEIDSRNLKAP